MILAAAGAGGLASGLAAQIPSPLPAPVAWTGSDAAPAFRTLKADPISPADAYAALGSDATSTNGLCRDYSANAAICPSGSRPRSPEIRELARALRNDPDLIYAYVRNSIDTEFQYGLAKGELGTVIDGSGTPFDQAKLMVELLRESGFTARYKFGDIQLTGAQLQEWLGASNAKAACTMLAGGGIPIQITASGGGSGCNLSGSVSSIIMAHVWVEADIQGQTVLFDPSYKTYEHLQGVDVRAAAGISTGDALSTATQGVSRTNGGATTQDYNASGLKTWLEARATTLRNWMNAPANRDKGVDEIVGGRRIVDAAKPVGGWRATSLPYVLTTRATWTSGVPDVHRTRLRILYHPGSAQNVLLTADLFTDEIYGRPMLLTSTGMQFDNIALTTAAVKFCPVWGVPCSIANNASMILDRPFAANAKTYGDSTVSRPLRSSESAAIVLGLGETSRGLAEKWGRENPRTNPMMPPEYPIGDMRRLNLAAEWLGQFSRAKELHQEIADAKVTHLHSLGIVYAISNTSSSYSDRWELADILDIESSVSVTTLDNDAPRRRALIQALAATAATLEGSVAEQLSDAPDSSSTARRIAWSNDPVRDPGVPIGSMPYFALPAGSAVPAASAFTEHEAYNSHIPTLRTALAAYLGKGFSITTAADAHLGPGRPWGTVFGSVNGEMEPWHAPSNERGGAFVATKYDVNGDPVEIAHVVTNYWTAAKGGGSGTSSGPPNATEMMRDGFEDRSSALGVNLSDGSVGYSSPVLRSIGQGEFPYKLEERLELTAGQVGASVRGWGNIQTSSNFGLVSNFLGRVTQANSGYVAMGYGPPEATAETLVGFAAMQDVYAASASADRDIVGLFVADWWGRQMIHNVVRVIQGAITETYSEAGTRSGKRLFVAAKGAYVLVDGELSISDHNATYPMLSQPRVYQDLGLSYEAMSGDGTKRIYEQGQIYAPIHRLKTWVFPAGVTLTFNYTNAGSGPASVTSNLGFTLPLSTFPAQIENSMWNVWPNTFYPCAPYSTAPANSFSFTDVAGRTHKIRFRQPVAQTLSTRPVYDCGLEAVFSPRSTVAPVTQYVYDSLGRVKEAKDASAIAGTRGSHQFFIAERNRGERQDPLGGRYAVETLRQGRGSRHIDEEGRVSLADMDGRGRVIRRVAAYGNITEFKYDDRDNMVELKRLPRAGCGTDTLYWCQTSTVTATYNAWNKPATVTLPATGLDGQAAHTWTFGYDSQGRLTSQTSPTVFDGKSGTNTTAVWQTGYDTYGRVNWTKDPTGIESRMEYGTNGQSQWCMSKAVASSQLVTGLNQTTTFTCNAAGDVLTATVGGNVTTFTYDVLRRKVTEVAPASTNIRTMWTYDVDNNVLTQSRWDATASLWRTTLNTWSPTGKLLATTDPSDDVARTCYDALDRPIVTVDPTGRATSTEYNAAGQPRFIKRWYTASTADAACALTQARPSHLTTNTWREIRYNAGGLQSAELDANGNATTMTYDGLGRPMLTTFADGKYVQTLRNERDQVYITFKRGGDVHQAYYDAIGRVTRVWEHGAVSAGLPYPHGRHTGTSYDLAGRPLMNWVSTQTATNGVYDASLERDVRTYVYDPAGRLIEDKVKPNDAGMGSAQLVTKYEYDVANNRTAIEWPDAYRATYRYDAANRMDRVQFGPSGNPTQNEALIALDSLSRRTGVNRSNGVNTTYAYEPDSDLSQMSHAFAPSAGQTPAAFGFTHDAAGRITLSTVSRPDLEWAPTLAEARSYGTPNNLNQWASANGVAMTWDHNGNLDSHGTTDYVWTWGNRLASVIKPASTTTYSYDGMDRRTLVVEDGVVTRTLWSGADEIGEYDNAGALKRRFIPDGSGAMDGRLATVSAASVVMWFHVDSRGSVVAMSNAAGQGAGFTNYSPHGKLGTTAAGVPLAGLPAASPFGYTGRQWDAKASLYQYRARYYDPELGIFLSHDPIGTKDDPNLYGYVGLDPANLNDPSGLCAMKDNQVEGCKIDFPTSFSEGQRQQYLEEIARYGQAIEASDDAEMKGVWASISEINLGPDTAKDPTTGDTVEGLATISAGIRASTGEVFLRDVRIDISTKYFEPTTLSGSIDRRAFAVTFFHELGHGTRDSVIASQATAFDSTSLKETYAEQRGVAAGIAMGIIPPQTAMRNYYSSGNNFTEAPSLCASLRICGGGGEVR